MPPKATNAPKRRGPAFKPPRPVKEMGDAVAPKRVPSTTASRPAVVPNRTVPAKRAAPEVLDSSEMEDDELNDDIFANLDRDELMDEAEEEPADAEGEVEDTQPPALSQTEAIPQKLLGRLLQEGFEDQNTKIHRGAMELTTKYMDLFVKEAISRAVLERQEANRRSGAAGISDGFLQVEDLERLTPQLVLDF